MNTYHIAKTYPTHEDALQYILELSAVLEGCADYFNDRSDVVDGEDGPRPNAEMRLLSEIEKVL